jgi:hypothetical protein
MAIQQARPQYNVKVVRESDGVTVQDQESSWPYAHIPAPTNTGVSESYTVTVEYVADHQFKQPYAKRLAAQQRKEEAEKKAAAERAAATAVRRRERIMNQIELAFVKQGKDAVKFVTCHECEALAEVLMLAYENPGSAVIAPEQITGALCKDHNPAHSPHYGSAWMPKVLMVPCAVLEFFYDGLKQIYINKS